MSEPDGSRETTRTPSTPEAARGAFPHGRLPLAVRYAELLATEGVLRGLIGPRETGRLWDRHLLNCAVLGEVLPADSTVADIGSGAGLPGIVVAIARPDLQVTLVEPLLRRATFLEEVVAELQLDGVRVVRARADALHGVERFDVVTARAVAPLARLLEWSMPLVSPEGELVAMKGSSVADEIADAADVRSRLGVAEPVVLTLGSGASTATVVRVTWADPSKVSWPLAGPHPRGSKPRTSRATKRRRKP